MSFFRCSFFSLTAVFWALAALCLGGWGCAGPSAADSPAEQKHSSKKWLEPVPAESAPVKSKTAPPVPASAGAAAPTAALAAPSPEQAKGGPPLKSPGPDFYFDAVVPDDDSQNRFLSESSFVGAWLALGPFNPAGDAAGLPGADSAVHSEFVKNEKELGAASVVPPGVAWRKVSAESDGKKPGMINLDRAFPNAARPAAAYALAVVRCPSEMSGLTLHCGSSDFIKIWINGSLVHTFDKEKRPSDIDQDTVGGIKLKKGANTVLVKTLVTSGPWSFYFRISTANDTPLIFTERSSVPVK